MNTVQLAQFDVEIAVQIPRRKARLQQNGRSCRIAWLEFKAEAGVHRLVEGGPRLWLESRVESPMAAQRLVMQTAEQKNSIPDLSLHSALPCLLSNSMRAHTNTVRIHVRDASGMDAVSQRHATDPLCWEAQQMGLQV